jgi:hypothetical protein
MLDDRQPPLDRDGVVSQPGRLPRSCLLPEMPNTRSGVVCIRPSRPREDYRHGNGVELVRRQLGLADDPSNGGGFGRTGQVVGGELRVNVLQRDRERRQIQLVYQGVQLS